MYRPNRFGLKYFPPKVLKTEVMKKGYHRVKLYKDSKGKKFFIHRLVAKAFIPNPENKDTVNHKDNDKSNNKVENLEWMTNRENYEHAQENNWALCHKGSGHPNSKLEEKDVLSIRKLRSKGIGVKEIAHRYKISDSHIYSICSYRTWKHC